MPSSAFGFISLVGCALLATGCNHSGAQRNFTTIGKPAMPSVAPGETKERGEFATADAATSVRRLARADDMAGAVAALLAVPEGAERTRLAGELATTLSEEQPARGAAFALALPQGGAQTTAVEAVARVRVKQDAAEALQWAAGVSNLTAGRVVRAAVAQHSVAGDARGTIDRIKALPAGPARDDLLVAAAGAWARLDANAAVSWLRDQPDDELKPRLTSNVGFEIAQTKPERAVAVAEMLPSGRDRWLLLSAIGQTWVAVDSKAAMTWAGQLPAGEPRDAALAGVDTGLGVPQRRRIAGVPGTRSGASRTRGGAGAMISLPDVNSPAFTAWLATQPAGLSKDEAILEYVRQRAALEPQTVGQWLTTLPGGATTDRAKELYIENVVPTAPAEAARWLRSMPRSDRTDAMMESTAKRWLQTNPESAELWLRDSTLPDFVKQRLLRDAGR